MDGAGTRERGMIGLGLRNRRVGGGRPVSVVTVICRLGFRFGLIRHTARAAW